MAFGSKVSFFSTRSLNSLPVYSSTFNVAHVFVKTVYMDFIELILRKEWWNIWKAAEMNGKRFLRMPWERPAGQSEVDIEFEMFCS